jgi:hypothetical protein
MNLFKQEFDRKYIADIGRKHFSKDSIITEPVIFSIRVSYYGIDAFLASIGMWLQKIRRFYSFSFESLNLLRIPLVLTWSYLFRKTVFQSLRKNLRHYNSGSYYF